MPALTNNRQEVKTPGSVYPFRDSFLSKRHLYDGIYIILLLVSGAYFFAGISRVPFHPDESTYIYTSNDWEAFTTHPLSLAFVPGQAITEDMRYRLIDAPFLEDVIGIGRSFAGLPPTPVDWDWTKSWPDNQSRGALPNDRLLAASRVAVGCFFPLTLICLYITCRKLNQPILGLVLVALVAANPLVLLHARRAMAEGLILFCTALFMLSLLYAYKKPWLIGLAAAIAVATKQSLFPLAIVGLFAVAWPGFGKKGLPFRRILVNVIIYSVVASGIFLLLNPVLWKNPISTAMEMVRIRSEFSVQQASDFSQAAPDQALTTPGKRVLAYIAQMFVTPPAYQDAANYSSDIQSQVIAYETLPLETSQRGLPWAGITFLFGFMGVYSAIKQLGQNPDVIHTTILFLVCTVLLSILLIALIPVAFQRYWLPLIPWQAFWEGWGILSIGRSLSDGYRTILKARTGSKEYTH